ncbi:hypothetical protein EU528_13180 [Candidatus Thorarchaeota archaeon]|nr:MAG: hypothetical protein EU528_13180 [Candidatus Thorarchaeota archaeon]
MKMERQIGLARIIVLFVVLLHVVPITGSSAIDTDSRSSFIPNSSQTVILDALSWEFTPLNCLAGDTISGEFILTNNGDLFIGDQTKYDNWLLEGIDFLILDADNYALWLDNRVVTSLFERNGVSELSWSIEIPREGLWYIVYFNDSIFMKQVEFNIQHISPSGFANTIAVVSLSGLTALLIIIFTFRKKK